MSIASQSRKINFPQGGNQKEIDGHQKASLHLQRAAKHHLDAAYFYSEGDHRKAGTSSLLSSGHFSLAAARQKNPEIQPKEYTFINSRSIDENLCDRQRMLNVHQEVISCLEKAVANHQQAGYYCSKGDQDKAAEYTIAAHAYQNFAKKAQREWQLYFGK